MEAEVFRALRALAVSSAKRSRFAPELPTIAESGVPGFDALTWYGYMAPAKTPRAVIDKLNAEANRILKVQELRERLGAEGADFVGGG